MREHKPVLLCWSMHPWKLCITNSAAGLMEQLINGRLVYPAEGLISHPQQGLTSDYQSTPQQSEWLQTHGRAEEPILTPSSSDSLTLIGAGALVGVAREMLKIGSTPNTDENKSVTLLHGAKGRPAWRQMQLGAVNADVHLKQHCIWKYRLRQR